MPKFNAMAAIRPPSNLVIVKGSRWRKPLYYGHPSGPPPHHSNGAHQDVRRTENFPSWVIKASLRVGDLPHQDLLAFVDSGSEYNCLNAKLVPEKKKNTVDVCATNVDGSQRNLLKGCRRKPCTRSYQIPFFKPCVTWARVQNYPMDSFTQDNGWNGNDYYTHGTLLGYSFFGFVPGPSLRPRRRLIFRPRKTTKV